MQPLGRGYAFLRAEGKFQRLSRLIPKFHFCSIPLFREEPLINWTYTNAVLFTAYDVYRSNDFWLDSVVNSGQTMKEALIDLGFPKANSLVMDTGVFEMEAKKAGISRDLGIDIEIELTQEQIFEAYELSGADFFVAPDEIILPSDIPEVINIKKESIKQNLLDLLDLVPPTRIIAVIQGHQKEIVDDFLEFYRKNGIEYFAAGGIIPLYHHDKELLHQHLKYVRKATENEWLHVFGLPKISLLAYYLHKIRVDSVDTSALTYLTAGRKYLVGLNPKPVRVANFEDCDCQGCSKLSKNMSTRSPEFFTNLYIHNIETASKESQKENQIESTNSTVYNKRRLKKPKENQKQQFLNILEIEWKTAADALQSEERSGLD